MGYRLRFFAVARSHLLIRTRPGKSEVVFLLANLYGSAFFRLLLLRLTKRKADKWMMTMVADKYRRKMERSVGMKQKATPSRGGWSEGLKVFWNVVFEIISCEVGVNCGISLGDRLIAMRCLVVDLHGWGFGAGDDRTRLFFSMFGFSLNFRDGWDIIFGEVCLVIALSPMRIFRIRTAHACFSHVYHLGDSIPGPDEWIP